MEELESQIHNCDPYYVLIVFYANWCEFSKIVVKVLDVIAATFPYLPVVAIDSYHFPSSMAREYEVVGYPTIILTETKSPSQHTFDEPTHVEDWDLIETESIESCMESSLYHNLESFIIDITGMKEAEVTEERVERTTIEW
eukprot:CAMPEP_0174276884 /NCGR_PEP_ID=MMETSP0439-20130205/60631_1 /TAXON_ID=0 /ORGANISM="Stereomyxa ramosa, Strain Chinc5" /LENGTH=140 /DNA_ID=CAMNT_0015369153 /DNA_START=88 /DNA_END=507 /DNA_ORIENTATION=+